jgi:hypothetical protein
VFQAGTCNFAGNTHLSDVIFVLGVDVLFAEA